MTEAVQIAVTVAAAPTLIAFGTLVVGWRNSRKSDAIHSMVDGNLSAVKADLALQTEHVKKLEDMLLKMTNASPIVRDVITSTPPATIPIKDPNL
jgi:hypothetical protein